MAGQALTNPASIGPTVGSHGGSTHSSNRPEQQPTIEVRYRNSCREEVNIIMRLVEFKLSNFRGYANETAIAIDPLTVIVGRNDAGKSTILDALDIFFNDAT